MLNKLCERNHTELHDPQLAALLREALADDPALAASPGRTNHIMRKVLSSGVVPARRYLPWGTFAWATTGLATMAAVFLVAVGLLHLQPNHQRQIAKIPQTTAALTGATSPNTPLPTTSQPDIPWLRLQIDTSVDISSGHDIPAQSPLLANEPADVTVADATPVKIAIALGETGSMAYANGDYQDAYDAYEASYTATPTPHALMGSAKALEQLSDQSLREAETTHFPKS